jgi:hypothetical protein
VSTVPMAWYGVSYEWYMLARATYPSSSLLDMATIGIWHSSKL